jgi:hypothetical protein
MTYDPLEWTVRDPLEDTVPDPIERRRLRPGRRRAIELVALLVLAPGLLVTEWVDNAHQSRGYQPHDHVTVVRRGATGTLGHVQLRLLGRDATGSPKSSTPGAISLKLVLQARPLDAKGAKDLDGFDFTLRDKDGHVWSAAADSTNPDNTPAVGVTAQLTVLGSVPEHLVNAVVLEARPSAWAASRAVTSPVLRFAH